VALAAIGAAVVLGVAGCGSAGSGAQTAGIPAALVRQARPIGRGAAFHPPATGRVIGRCRKTLGPRVGVHVELFAANRVVLVAAGIGVRGPVRRFEGRIVAAGCFGELTTIEPTGVVLIVPGARLTVADLFRAWGQPLSDTRVAGFTGRVRVYVAGRRRPAPAGPGATALAAHAEIVLEVGPYVSPHAAYRFPPGS
jgi:hypothetical protein